MTIRGAARDFAALPSPVVFLLLFAAVVLLHATLLRLPFFWDEGGYYIPAALDFYHGGGLIPAYTNAHPPLPNILLGGLWHATGFAILPTRLAVCAVAAGALTAVFRLAEHLLGPAEAGVVTVLTAVYPIWYTQSSLAHADIFAALFTLWAFTAYIRGTALSQGDRQAEAGTLRTPRTLNTPSQMVWSALLFSLAALAKETAIVQPAALAGYHLYLLVRDRAHLKSRQLHLRWFVALSFPVLPLAAWFAYHRAKTGFIFGNPEYLRYNATANFTLRHLGEALWFRFLHLSWQRNMWIPLLFAVLCLPLPRRAAPDGETPGRATSVTFAVLLAANWLAFSVLGGALLTRYLLPMYPLLLIAAVAVWRARTPRWPFLALVSGAAFVAGWWLNPPTYFAPEDNLTYRDMVVVHQEAIRYVENHFPEATVLTSWPVAGDLARPELGYLHRPLPVTPLENFTAPEILKAAREPGRYDTAITFATQYISPSLRQYFLAHPDSRRGRKYAHNRDLAPFEVAALLGGHVVWQEDRNGEWAAVLRFPRSYAAGLTPSIAPETEILAERSGFLSSRASRPLP